MKPGKSLRWVGAGTLATLMLGAGVVTSAAAFAGARDRVPSPTAAKGEFVSGQAIVRFEPGAGASLRQNAKREAGASFESTLRLPRAQVVDVDGSVEVAVRDLERQPGVAYAQPNYRYEATAVEPPNDSFFGELWGLEAPTAPDPGVYALGAWEDNLGAGQVIAVLDTGVDLTHPDLAPNLWEDSGSGDHGHDFVDGDDDPDDFNYHGTHVAGTAAAAVGNALGVAGVAPAAEIMSVRVLDGDGSGFTDDIAAGIAYAGENGADVINMSLGGPAGAGDKAMSDAIAEAGAEGVVTVVAAGNEGADNDAERHTPCALPNPTMICVAALNRSGALAGFSNYGAETVDLAAPGTSILSAKTDYGAPVFEEGFEGGLASWASEAFNGAVAWGTSESAASGSKSATDSPGSDYGHSPAGSNEYAESDLYTTEAVDLTAERGCRVLFRTKYEIESSSDGFFAGAVSESPFEGEESFDGILLDGTSPGYPGGFTRKEASISRLDGRDDAHPIYAVVSDEEVEFDGAHVDDVRLICRDETYNDSEAKFSEYDQPESGNYIRFSGTSMASPHVAGVAALVQGAAPALTAQQAVDAVLEGASAMPSPDAGRPTATNGIADACKAIAVATGGSVATGCPASSEASPPGGEEEGGEEREAEAEEGESGGGRAPSTSGETASDESPPGSGAADALTVADRTRPRIFFRWRARRRVLTPRRRGRVVFRFASDELDARFICRLDGRQWRFCQRRIVMRLGPGRHVLRVRAVDAAGNVSRFAAVHRFRVRRIRR